MKNLRSRVMMSLIALITCAWVLTKAATLLTNAGSATAVSLANGNIFIVKDRPGGGHQSQVVTSASATQDFHNFAPIPLAQHLPANLTARTNGRSPEMAEPMFSTQDFSRKKFVRNPNFWLEFAPEKTAIVIAHGNPLSGSIGGSAVTPRHVLNCAHSPYGAGDVLFFVDDNGTVISRSITQSVYLGSNDVQGALLNSDLPATVHPFKILPTTYTNILTNATSGRLGLVCGNQLNQLFPKTGSIHSGGGASVSASSDSAMWGAWNYNVIAGDSGHPIMLLVGTNLVLAGHWWFSSAGPSYTFNASAINAQLHYLSTNNGLGSDYQLTPIDLSDWATN